MSDLEKLKKLAESNDFDYVLCTVKNGDNVKSCFDMINKDAIKTIIKLGIRYYGDTDE